MSTEKNESKGDAAESERTPEEIKAEIEETREDLADTVAALAEKADVKAQARKKVDETKERISGAAGSAKAKVTEATPAGAQDAAKQGSGAAQDVVRENPVPAAAVGALVLGFLLGWLIARRSRT